MTGSSIWKNIYEERQFTDLRVQCQDTVFDIHKAVVCSRSTFFAKVVNATGFVENMTNTIDLPDDKVEYIERLLEFMYTDEYKCNFTTDQMQTRWIEDCRALVHEDEIEVDESVFDDFCQMLVRNESSTTKTTPPTTTTAIITTASPRWIDGSIALKQLIHVEMFTLGDKYGIQGLEEYAKSQFCQNSHLGQSCAPEEYFVVLFGKIYRLNQQKGQVYQQWAIQHYKRAFHSIFEKDVTNRNMVRKLANKNSKFGTDLFEQLYKMEQEYRKDEEENSASLVQELRDTIKVCEGVNAALRKQGSSLTDALKKGYCKNKKCLADFGITIEKGLSGMVTILRCDDCGEPQHICPPTD